MYRVTPLNNKLLITTDEVIALAPTEDSVSIRILLNSIQGAEQRFIKPTLGKDLYNDLREKKNVLVTEDNLDDLEDQASEAGDTLTLKEGDMLNSIELVENEWYRKLWVEHLWKLTSECVMYVATPVNYSRFTAQGEVLNQPRSISIGGNAASTSVDLKDIQWKLDQLLQNRIDPAIAAMKEWLYDNRLNFPLYTDSLKQDGVSVSRKTAWVHGIYDKKKRKCDDD